MSSPKCAAASANIWRMLAIGGTWHWNGCQPIMLMTPPCHRIASSPQLGQRNTMSERDKRGHPPFAHQESIVTRSVSEGSVSEGSVSEGASLFVPPPLLCVTMTAMDKPIGYFHTWATYGTWLPGDSRVWGRYGTCPTGNIADQIIAETRWSSLAYASGFNDQAPLDPTRRFGLNCCAPRTNRPVSLNLASVTSTDFVRPRSAAFVGWSGGDSSESILVFARDAVCQRIR